MNGYVVITYVSTIIKLRNRAAVTSDLPEFLNF